jgi:radical SAM superfamily enzyme YgiQ (UPF0313 family)
VVVPIIEGSFLILISVASYGTVNVVCGAMKKLLLISPVGQRSGFLLSRISTFPPLGLAYVAAVTPSDWHIKIIDENFNPFVFEEADLVGITAFTSSITRAYEIAGIYRARNIKVVMGGIHVSMKPDEALQYADSVIVGEAEGIWGKVIDDFNHDRLSPRYIGPQIDLTHFNVTPRRDLLRPDYLWHPVQTSRGCPFDCDFCSVSRHLGKHYRQRSAEDVLSELSQIQGKYIAFVDDNLVGYSQESKLRAKDLFQGMIQGGLKKKWWMQTSINAADDERTIELAARAGCMFVFIGFESINDEMLKGMNKRANLKTGVENYRKVVNAFHRYGIAVLGAFIIGNNHESPAYYRKLADFIVHSGIDIVQISILTPLPGTRLMDQMEKEGRLLYMDFPDDWDKYRFSHVVHRMNGLEPDLVYRGNNYIKNRLYSFPTSQYRLMKSLFSLKQISNFYTVMKMNQVFKRSWKASHYRKNHSAKSL